jgi:cytidylate kinase
MAARVVCVSRTLGSGGEAVGMAMARALAYRYVDDEIVRRAAEKAHVELETMMEAEHRKSFVRRLLDGLPSAATLTDPFSSITGAPLGFEEVALLGPRTVKQDPRDVIRSVIADCADAGRVVIVAHAASMALAGTPGVLRILVTASPEVRAARVARDRPELDPTAAAAVVRDSDRDRRDYFHRFYDIAREEATHYDLVINTDALTPRQASDVACATAVIDGF